MAKPMPIPYSSRPAMTVGRFGPSATMIEAMPVVCINQAEQSASWSGRQVSGALQC